MNNQFSNVQTTKKYDLEERTATLVIASETKQSL